MACSSKINVIMALVMIVTLVSIGQATAARRLQQAGGLPGFPSYPLPTTPGFPTPSVVGFPSFPMPTTPGFPTPSDGGFPGLPSFLPAPSDPNVPAKTTTP
ncbi:hypothetical protein BC332_32430 [Capsicum chinense]|nr:hypothetical protein BC332_32430 [Capsicum chinense]